VVLKDVEYSQVQARAKKIRDETRMFVEACKLNIQKARSLCDDTARLREETMILEEECIADKSKSLAILKLSSQHKILVKGGFAQVSSIGDDTSTLLQMIDEIKQTSIPDESSLHTLRSNLLGLSFLPGS
jgi:hypothetical protein